MGVEFKHQCPHCLSIAAGFRTHDYWHNQLGSTRAYLIARCGVCDKGIILDVQNKNGTTIADPTQYSYSFQDNLRIISCWPEVQVTIPADLPGNVANFYTQGLENLAGARWDAAGAMFRKTLDVATKIIAPSEKNLTLYKRIEKLVSDNLLTEAMGAWSHEIRIDGNDAVHDEDPETEDDAGALQKFCEAFLTYAFSLPSMVLRNREKRDAGENP